MMNLRITTRALEDGSLVHQVKFEATHADSTHHTVVLEAMDRKAVARLFDALNEDVAYAETDPS
jgi:hypothetical protein